MNCLSLLPWKFLNTSSIRTSYVEQIQGEEIDNHQHFYHFNAFWTAFLNMAKTFALRTHLIAKNPVINLQQHSEEKWMPPKMRWKHGYHWKHTAKSQTSPVQIEFVYNPKQNDGIQSLIVQRLHWLILRDGLLQFLKIVTEICLIYVIAPLLRV